MNGRSINSARLLIPVRGSIAGVSVIGDMFVVQIGDIR